MSSPTLPQNDSFEANVTRPELIVSERVLLLRCTAGSVACRVRALNGHSFGMIRRLKQPNNELQWISWRDGR